MLNADAFPEFAVQAALWAMRGTLLLLLAVICVSDFRARRIPNRLVLAGLLVALAWQALGPAGTGLFHAEAPGALGAASGFAGAAVAFAGFLLLYLMRTMGAGDVKLMAMLGAFFGVEALPALVPLVFLAGGVLVALRLFDGTRRRAVCHNVRLIVFGRLAALAGGVGPQFDPRTDSADRLPFALAISGGALLLAALQLTGVNA
ncbi:MAG: prepilin peptidase [Burkholderiaceae bacterium]|nr:prepilin peptidase [Burkholderiaceae bacterium]